MNIAVNTRLLLKDKMEGIGRFTFEILKRLTVNHPEHHFFFLFDRPYNEEFIFSDNITPIIIGLPARHPILFYLWFEFSVASALKSIKADLFISPDGYLSLRSKVPQLAVIHDLNFEEYPEHYPWLIKKYYHYFFPRFARKATRIVTVSEFSKKDISTRYKINPELIDVVYNDANSDFKPLSPELIKEVRNKYSNGKPYFLFIGSIQPRKNIKNLMLAFDEFRKQSTVEIKLILAGSRRWWSEELEMRYQSLAYKTDVIFTGRVNDTDLSQLMASAAALTYIPFFEGFGIPILEAFASGVPVISSNTTSIPEVAQAAALLVDPIDINGIAEAMAKVVSDDQLRNELVAAGFQRRKGFSWDESAEKMGEIIEKMLCT